MTSDRELHARAEMWRNSGDTGISSEAICAWMLDGTPARQDTHPRDPADLGRCLRLLALFPEWAPRIGEMAKFSPYWDALTARWDDISKCMADEVGIDWSKGEKAERTWKLMRFLLEPVERADPRRIEFREGVTVRFN